MLHPGPRDRRTGLAYLGPTRIPNPHAMKEPMRWLLLLLCSGCASIGAMQSADTLGQGKMQVALEVSEQASVSRDTLTVYPMFGTAVRIGVFDWLDVGIRVGPSGGELQPKYRFTKRGSPLIISVAPSFGVSILDTNGITLRFYNIGVPVLFGIPIEGGHQLVLSARFNDTIAYESAGSARGLLNLMTGSLSAGFAARVWRFLIMPELAVGLPLWTTSDRYDVEGGVTFGAGRATVQLNMTVMWGGVRE